MAAGAAVVLAADAVGRRRRSRSATSQPRPRAAGRRYPGVTHSDASRPSQIPAAGWKAVALRVWEKSGEDRILLVAAGVTFYALLALFPAVAAVVSVFGLVADPSIINQQLQHMENVLPGGALDIVGGQVQRIASQSGGALGFGFVAGLLVSLWSANAGMKSLFEALNIAYDEEEKRSFIMLNAQALALTVGAMAFLVAAIGAIVVLPAVFAFLGLGAGTTGPIISLARWPLLLIGVGLALAILYRIGPSREAPRWRWVTWGSAIAAFVWLAGSALFSWYVANFGNYNETYGSLGAAIGFLIWIWLSAIVVLLGAELNAELEKQGR